MPVVPLRAAWLGIASVLTFIISLVPAAPAEAACTPAPVLREVNRNQTLPYGGGLDLVAGRNTLVKAHLTLNECTAGTSASVQITGGQLTVASGAGTTAVPVAQVPSGPIEACCTPAINSAGDPKFLVDGSRVAQPGPAVFQATLNYTYKTTATAAPVQAAPAVFDFTGRFSATVPVRALVVPLGDGRDPYRTWFPVTAETIVQNAFQQTAARILPVAAGACTPIQSLPLLPGEAACGIQYSIAPSLLDVGPRGLNILRPDGTFCDGDFDKLKLGLTQFLLAYNLANPDRAADVVTGYIDESKSPTCSTQGRAMVGSVQSWFRGVADTTKRPSSSGGVLVQELTHNRGVRGTPGWHSPATEADAGSQRAHNLITLAYEPNDRSVMNFSSLGWHNLNVGFEQQDWSCMMLALGGNTSGCPAGSLPVSTGSAPAAGGKVLLVGGRSDGTPATPTLNSCSPQTCFQTTVAEAAESLNETLTPFGAVYVDQDLPEGSRDVDRFPLAGSREATHGSGSSNVYVIDDALPVPGESIDVIEIRNGTQVIWSVDATSLPPRNVVAKVRPTRWSFENLSQSSGTHDVDPALSTDGEGDELVVWVRHDHDCAGGGGRLVVRRLGDSSSFQTRDCLGNISAPDWRPPHDPTNPDLRQIALIQDGNVVVINVDLGTSTFGGSKIVFCASAGVACVPRPGAIQGAASGPAYSPAGDRIAFSVDQPNPDDPAGPPVADLAMIPAGADASIPPDRLTLTPGSDERNVTWSHTPEDASDRPIAFECGGVCDSDGADGQPELHTLATANLGVPATATTGLGVGARDPSWGDGFIAAEQGGRIITIYPDDAGAQASVRNVTGPGTGFEALAANPSMQGSLGPVAFASDGPAGSPDDVWVARSTSQQGEISITAEDDTPQEQAAEVNYAHAWAEGALGEARPLGVGILPTTFVGSQLTFHLTVDLARVGAGTTVLAGVSDQEHIAFNKESGRPDLGSLQRAPLVAINVPPGSVWPNTEIIALQGSVEDPESGGEATGSPDRGDVTFEWTLDPPGPTGPTAAGTSPRLVLQPPLNPGTYTAELRATASSSVFASASTGEPSIAGQGCTPPACSSATLQFEVAASGPARFDPSTWQVPSNGVVTYTFKLPGVDLKKVGGAAITQVNGLPVTDWPDPATPFPASLKVQGDSIVAKVDRAAPNSFFLCNGLVGQRVLLTLEGSIGGGARFMVADYERPTLQPAEGGGCV